MNLLGHPQRIAHKLNKNKSIVSTFSVFVAYKSAVSTTQKRNYVGCFNLSH